MALRFAVLFALVLAAPVIAEEPAVRLVVQITVDQLRGDMPLRFAGRLPGGGFRYLMDHGVHFTNAHYRHATTFTACGHATLFTGGNPAHHGICGNEWRDPVSGAQVVSVEDDRHTIFGVAPKAHAGTSPRNLLSSTTGDEIVNASGGRSRVFSISLKDRGAILPGGFRGKAFWYQAGRFITSSYYYPAEPAWLAEWNSRKLADQYRGKKWELLGDRATYWRADRDDDPAERPQRGMGRVFPHLLDGEKPDDIYENLVASPMGDELTLAFVKHVAATHQLGRGPAVDMLNVSFTCTDYVGHIYGPDSLEAEDNMLRLDRTLAEFFRFLDETVGLSRTLIVLSADHGVDSSPEYRHQQTCAGLKPSDRVVYRTPGEMLLKFRQSQGQDVMCCSAGRHFPDQWIAGANEALASRFKLPPDAKLIFGFFNPSLYLDPAVIQSRSLNVEEVERALADHLMKVPGVAHAVTRTDLLRGAVAADPVMQRVQRSFHPQRSGNVLVVQQPFWYLYPKPAEFASMHGSPYNYDTHVPILFAGPRVGRLATARPVGPEDIAPTITAYLGVEAPSGSVGEPLAEVLMAPAK